MQSSNNLQFIDLGLMPYQEVWDLQKDEFQKAIDIKHNNEQLETEKIFLSNILMSIHWAFMAKPIICLPMSACSKTEE